MTPDDELLAKAHMLLERIESLRISTIEKTNPDNLCVTEDDIELLDLKDDVIMIASDLIVLAERQQDQIQEMHKEMDGVVDANKRLFNENHDLIHKSETLKYDLKISHEAYRIVKADLAKSHQEAEAWKAEAIEGRAKAMFYLGSKLKNTDEDCYEVPEDHEEYLKQAAHELGDRWIIDPETPVPNDWQVEHEPLLKKIKELTDYLKQSEITCKMHHNHAKNALDAVKRLEADLAVARQEAERLEMAFLDLKRNCIIICNPGNLSEEEILDYQNTKAHEALEKIRRGEE